ncbi:hypothetical protein CLOM_g724 [Closterium sp. NIES-68]|nr:hypothetical protein CLOM_g22568 [Closterium sp. NIES-68]GJP41086.1 hypothetical protein CLOM_g724 [Closterium sp. NIES-68]GJP65400.1 hypothetical protein CLOP_g22285 [Closterium sp. NIES-67]
MVWATDPQGGEPRDPAELAALSAIQNLQESEKPVPKLVVFDLDYTLWPFWCECRRKSDNPRLYPEAGQVLSALAAAGIPFAFASRTPTPDIARVFLDKLGFQMEDGSSFSSESVNSRRSSARGGNSNAGGNSGSSCSSGDGNGRSLKRVVRAAEIYPSWSHKTEHFEAIRKRTEIAYSDMLFFDDESRNTREIGSLGVTSVLVENGVTVDELKVGLAQFVKKHEEPPTEAASNRETHKSKHRH